MNLTGLADLHMHTTVSDGFATVHELLDYVAEQGRLNVIAITDHDRLEASLWAYHHRHHYPFDIVPGVEISSQGGHVLGLWVTEPVRRISRWRLPLPRFTPRVGWPFWRIRLRFLCIIP